MKLGLTCPKCEGEIKPGRKPPYALREYRLRLYECVNCRKQMAVAWFVVGRDKAKWMEMLYEEHVDNGL